MDQALAELGLAEDDVTTDEGVAAWKGRSKVKAFALMDELLGPYNLTRRRLAELDARTVAALLKKHHAGRRLCIDPKLLTAYLIDYATAGDLEPSAAWPGKEKRVRH